ACYFARHCSQLSSRPDDDVFEPKVHDRVLRVQADDLWLRSKDQSAISKVADDADDCDVRVVPGICCSGLDLQRFRRSNMNLAPNRILVREITPAEFLIDQRDRLGRARV